MPWSAINLVPRASNPSLLRTGHALPEGGGFVRRIFVSLSIALLMFSGVAVTASGAGAATPTVVLDSLTVPVDAQPGQAVKASARVHSTGGTVTAQPIMIGVRSSTGLAYDFPGATTAIISSAGYTYTSGPRTFPSGTYTAFAEVRINGQWTNLPAKSFTV
jgi:hypothetical protein